MDQLVKPTFMRLIFLLTLLPIAGFTQNPVSLESDRDNTLLGIPSTLDTNSNGSGPHFFAGRNNQTVGFEKRGLLHFDVAGSLSPGIMVDSVTLQIHMSQAPNAQPYDFELRSCSADWGEGTSFALGGSGDTAEANDATWYHTHFNTQFWTTPGGDYSASADASFIVSDTGVYLIPSNSNLVTRVQDWVDNPANNHGWVVLGDESISQSTKRFDSRENSNPTFRPVLTIWWTDPNNIHEPHLVNAAALFPNPSTDIVNLTYGNQQFVQSVKIYDLSGKLLKTQTVKAARSNLTIHVADLVPGNYLVSVHTENERYTHRLTISR